MQIVSSDFIKINQHLFLTTLHRSINQSELNRLDAKLLEFNNILESVTHCQTALERKNGWLRFGLDESKCPPDVTTFLHPTTQKRILISTLKHELPQHFKYDKDKGDDFPLSVSWKVVDLVHSACYEYWMDDSNNMGVIPFQFIGFMEEIFQHETIQHVM